MRVYHFINRNYGIESLRNRRLKMATFDDLNDHFELRGFATDDPIQRSTWENFRRQFARQIGILCFSKKWRNPVQWSHYADKHRGLCLGFEVDPSVARSVRYSAKPHPTSLLNEMNSPDETVQLAAMETALTTKYSHWRYEEEVRLFVSRNEPDKSGLYFKEFGTDLKLREVIVGPDCPLTRIELSDALGPSSVGIETTKARRAFKSFRIVRQRNASLWR